MSISRGSLRKWLVVAGCVCAQVHSPAAVAGGLLIAVGALLHGITKAYLRQNRMLTTAGPYRWTRNPFYLANALIDGGILFVIGQPLLAALFIPIWIIAYRGTIAGEEAQLEELFGEAFTAYRNWVPVLIPWRRPWPKERAEGHFDWDNPNLTRGREYARMVGIGLAPLAIWASEIIRQEGGALFAPNHSASLGWILLIPALWVFKLALAETFRRPERALVPDAVGGGGRLGGTFLVMLPLVMTGFASNGLVVILLCAGLIIGGFLFVRGTFASGARLLDAAIAFGLIALCVAAGLRIEALWLAVLPSLWLALVALDHLGAVRHQRFERSDQPRTLWRYGPRVGLAAFAGWAIVASLVYGLNH